MKKNYFKLLAFICGFALLWVSNADGILDYLNYAELDMWNFWYTSSDRLNIDRVSTSYVDVSSPVIKNEWNNITSYLFAASTEKWYRNPVAFWCFDDVAINWNRFSVELDTDDLIRSEVYYLYAVPVDSVPIGNSWKCSSVDAQAFVSVWTVWKDSAVNGEDPCFSLENSVYWEWNYCEDHVSWNWGWWSDWLVYSIRAIDHAYSDDRTSIVLTWESLTDTNIEVYLRDDDAEKFNSLWTVNSERRSFSCKVTRNWDYIFRLRPADWWIIMDYTAHDIQTKSPEVTPVVTPDTPVKPPVVWPKENILMIVFWTLILYIVYRIAVRKRS